MPKEKPSIPKITTKTELSNLLNIEETTLNTILEQIPHLYKEIKIKKSDGNYRTIYAPNDSLKTIQRTILDNILISIPLLNCAYGFGKSKSIIDNAYLHSKSPYLLNVDIKNFFPSVHFSRIHKLFTELGLNPLITKILTGLTTLNHCLPQGAPTSPYLASLALKNLDQRIMSLCSRNRLIYSRYFDDITISGGGRAHSVINTIEEIIKNNGYEMHKGPNKLRLSGPSEEKLVTGILIKDGKLSTPISDDVLKYIFSLQSKGMAGLADENPLKERLSLSGKINYIKQVDHTLGLKLNEEFNKIIW